ncbi:MAG: hypothetical protein WAK58_13585, partial [Trebonia sp.]
MQLAMEERLVVQAGAGAAPDARRRRASTRRRPGDSRTRWPETRWKFKIIHPGVGEEHFHRDHPVSSASVTGSPAISRA